MEQGLHYAVMCVNFFHGTYQNLECALAQSMCALIIHCSTVATATAAALLFLLPLLENIIIYVYEDKMIKQNRRCEKSRHEAYGIDVKRIETIVCSPNGRNEFNERKTHAHTSFVSNE